jgi:GNAT superfamily N-acetyltransferase
MILTKLDWPAMEVKLRALFRESFGRPIQEGYLDWRYIANGQEQLLFAVTIHGQDPVASYSAFPVDLTCDGKTCQTAMSMTTMTHPHWRGKGLFQQLAAELYSQAGVNQIAAIWGFPNASSHPTFNGKLGWSDIYEIPTLTLDLTKTDIGQLALNAQVQRDDEFSLDYPDPPMDGLIRVHRSKSYLSWRYACNPVNTYYNFTLSLYGKVSSYVVTKSYGDGVDLVDIQSANSQEARILLTHVAKLSFDKGARQICCWAPTHHNVHDVLERLGFQNSSPITYFGGRELIPSAAPFGWSSYKNWYVQMGDSDVY